MKYRNDSAHPEECNVVPDEVLHYADFLCGLSLSLEEAAGEDSGQFFTGHVIEVWALMNPERQEINIA